VACASYFHLQLTFVAYEAPFRFLKLTKDNFTITYMTFACGSEVVMTSSSDIRSYLTRCLMLTATVATPFNPQQYIHGFLFP
jgi:hypothetical protein